MQQPTCTKGKLGAEQRKHKRWESSLLPVGTIWHFLEAQNPPSSWISSQIPLCVWVTQALSSHGRSKGTRALFPTPDAAFPSDIRSWDPDSGPGISGIVRTTGGSVLPPLWLWHFWQPRHSPDKISNCLLGFLLLISLFAHPQAWSLHLLLTWGGPDSHPTIPFDVHGPQHPPDAVPGFKFLLSLGARPGLRGDHPQPQRGEDFTNALLSHWLWLPARVLWRWPSQPGLEAPLPRGFPSLELPGRPWFSLEQCTHP